MGILGRLFGGTGGGDLPSAIKEDLKRLNRVEPGLGDKAVVYVATGEGGTVLSTIEQKADANPLGLGEGFYKDQKTVNERRKLLYKPQRIAPVQLGRYGEILAASLKKALATNKWLRIVGTDQQPLPLRVVLHEALQPTLTMGVYVHNERVRFNLALADALDMASCLGGRHADVYAILYAQSGSGYGPAERYRKGEPVGDYAAAHPVDFAAGVAASGSDGIAAAFEDLKSWRLAARAEFRPILLGALGSGSKKVRAAAASALSTLPGSELAALVADQLATGNADARTTAVDMAAADFVSLEPVLRAHLETEKTARVRSAIENLLHANTVTGKAAAAGADTGDGSGEPAARPGAEAGEGYRAADGQWIAIPPLVMPPTEPMPDVTAADRAALNAEIDRINAEVDAHNKGLSAADRRHQWMRRDKVPSAGVSLLLRLAAGIPITSDERDKTPLHNLLNEKRGAGRWFNDMLGRMPAGRMLRVAQSLEYGPLSPGFGGFAGSGMWRDVARRWIVGPDGDLRAIEAIAIELAMPSRRFRIYGNQANARPIGPGELVLMACDRYGHYGLAYAPAGAAWPYLATNLDQLEAILTGGSGTEAFNKVAPLRLLAMLPALPSRFVHPLLEIATGPSKTGKKEARALLASVPGLTDRLSALLDDSRQVVRAGAADWLAERADGAAAPALRKRLAREKSDIARAALIQALQKLGDPLDDVIGEAALIGEAEKGVAGAKAKAPDWLNMSTAPQVSFKSGKPLPSAVLHWWAALATKMKDPGATRLTGLWLDQLAPDDARKFSGWVLDAWIDWDTVRPSMEEANAYASANAKARYDQYKQWYKGFTELLAFAQLKNERLAVMPNSAADAKGLLALACRARPADAAGKVRAFLKEFGQRTSQANALLDMLAGIDHPAALQVVLATSMRIKQKSVQKRAGELVQAIADSRGWTVEELADRTVPTAGFDDAGELELLIGEDEKRYLARLGDDLSIIIANPAGKVVSSLPTGSDPHSAESKRLLSNARKELKQVITLQTARLYEMMCTSRAIGAAEWKTYLHAHPVLRKLLVRTVWEGLDGDGNSLGAFRPTQEGDFTDATDGSVDLSAFATVRLAHPALMAPAAARAWEAHLKDYEVKPLFTQFGRPVQRLEDSQKEDTAITDRKGWSMDTFTLRGLASKLGYERGGAGDGGWFDGYVKRFPGSGIEATAWFTGAPLPEENMPCALIELTFEKVQPGERWGAGAIPLKDVAPVLLSEAWNDWHLLASKGTYDPDWEKKR